MMNFIVLVFDKKMSYLHTSFFRNLCTPQHNLLTMVIMTNFFVCLFVWGFSSHLIIVHSYGDVTIAGEGLQILTCARHSRPLSSESSLACHTYCDTGIHLKSFMVISEDPWHPHLLPSVMQCSCYYLFLRLRSVAAGIQTPCLARRTL